MVKRISPVGVVSFVLLAACGAVCRDVRQSLPDAPSVQAATQAQGFGGFSEQAHSPLKLGAMGAQAGVMRRPEFTTSDRLVFSPRESNTIFAKYLYPSSFKQQSGYRSVSNSSLMGRATYAASRHLITRDDSGRARLNTSYLLRTLTSVAKDAASTPYWRRSLNGQFNDFGSTVGSDAGMNLWREFGPGIQHLMKSHAPKFVSKIEESVVHH
jgi:hypothetical protein